MNADEPEYQYRERGEEYWTFCTKAEYAAALVDESMEARLYANPRSASEVVAALESENERLRAALAQAQRPAPACPHCGSPTGGHNLGCPAQRPVDEPVHIALTLADFYEANPSAWIMPGWDGHRAAMMLRALALAAQRPVEPASDLKLEGLGWIVDRLIREGKEWRAREFHFTEDKARESFAAWQDNPAASPRIYPVFAALAKAGPAVSLLSETRQPLVHSTESDSGAVQRPAGEDLALEVRSWPEDARLENGSYFNLCCNCRLEFVGYKRRNLCRVCAG